MPLPYLELHYASTQQSLLTGADGFGIRTFSEGFPKEIIERLKSRNVFVYQTGNKALAGIFDLLKNPNLVLEYPETFTFFREELEEQVFYMFTRTIFLGRDYGWYLATREESARSGNLFCHAVIFKEADFFRNRPEQVFQALTQELFLPRNPRNNPDNAELRQLLTNLHGVPTPLPLRDCLTCELPVSPTIKEVEETVLAVYDALETQRRVVVVLPESQTKQHILSLLACLPKFVLKSVSFATNSHEFNLYTDYTLVFVNELYQREVPADHPYLLVCDYRAGHFPAHNSSDFSNYVLRLVQSGNLAELQVMNEELDGMTAKFSEGMSFNSLFYAWLHLLTDKQGYHFQPDEIVRKVKDYPLTPSFRNRLNEYVLFSFKQALDSEKHAKVASSLQLLDETKMEDSRREDAERRFTEYFFKDDNAAALYRHTQDLDLMMKTLWLGGQEAEIFSFIGRSTLPVATMEFLILRFCANLTFDGMENILYSAMLSDKISPSFGSDLVKTIGVDTFLMHDFFAQFGDKLQPRFFGTETKGYLQQMALNGKDALYELRLKIANYPFLGQYADCLLEISGEECIPYTRKVEYLDFYTGLIKSGQRSFLKNEALDNLLRALLNGFEKPSGEQEQERFSASLRGFGILAQQYQSKVEKEESPEWTLYNFYKLTAALMLKSTDFGNDVENFSKILPIPTRKGWSSLLLRFMLSALSPDTWRNRDDAMTLCRYFFSILPFKEQKHAFQGEELEMILFIPAFYAQRFTLTKHDEGILKDFFKAYTEAVWGLRRYSGRDSQDIAKIYSPAQLCERVAIYLNRLKEVDKQACREVVEYISTEMPDSDTDLIEYVQSKVQLDNPIKSLFKRFSPFKKD